MKTTLALTRVARIILTVMVVAAWAATATTAQQELRPMLRIMWREGPEYPTGIQESACGFLGGRFISAGGFTRHPKNLLQLYPEAFGGAPSGFTAIGFAFDPRREADGWVRIPDIPGPPRQGAATVVVGDALYAVGGVNYTEPLTYQEVYRLVPEESATEAVPAGWTRLPCDVPWPVCEASAVTIGRHIYLLCAADYFRAPGATEPDFHSEAGRSGVRVGAALLTLDTQDLPAGWRRLADLPGTPRLGAAVASAGGRIYVLGGVYAPVAQPGQGPYSDDSSSYHYYNVVDSWVYDPSTDAWTRLPDMPDGANRRAVTYQDRYVIMLGGYKYPQTWLPDGSRRDVYSPEEKQRDWKQFFHKTVLVYDTLTGELGTADPLLEQTSWPGVAIDGNTIFSLGGEGGRLWHPATFQIGTIVE